MEPPPSAPRSLLQTLAPFPRVSAAGAGAGGSEADGMSQQLPYYIPEPRPAESGWDRLRELFVRE